jgi:hypothetical protein
MITTITIGIWDEILCEHWIFDGHNSLGKGSSRTWDRSGGASTKSWGYLNPRLRSNTKTLAVTG